MVAILGTHGFGDLFADMAGSGRMGIWQDGNVFVMGAAQRDIMGARAVHSQGALEDADADRCLGFVDSNQKQGEGDALR